MVDTKRKSRSGDSEGGPMKRQRVSRACDQCRTAREKCDGIQPICFTCASSNRDCTYTTNPKRRGIQPGYIRTLELTLAWTLCNVGGTGDALIGLLQDEKGQLLISSVDSTASNNLHNKWRKHVVSKAIDRVLSGESTNDLFEQAISTSGEDEDEEEPGPEPPVQPISLLTPDSLRAAPPQFQSDDILDPQYQYMQSQTAQIPVINPHPLNQRINIPSNHWRLIDVYFAYTHSWLPLASKERILKLCYSYPNIGLELIVGRDSADHAELWSIMALASIQERSTRQQSVPTNVDILGIAESLVYPVVEDADVGHIGALLTLALVNIALQRLSLAWLLLGRAIRAGLWLELDHSRQTSVPSQAADRLRGLVLGCFVVETVLAAQLGAVPNLRTDFIQSLGLIPEEGLDEWQPWSGCDGFSNKQPLRPTLPSQAKSTFNQLLKLCYIFNDRIIERKFSLHTASSTASLSHWLATLPASLGPLHSMSPDQTSPQKLHLFLAFLVGRAFDSDNHTTIEEALPVLDHFTYALGLAAMPPLFACFLNILKEKSQDDGFQQNRLAGILTRFATVWRGISTGDEATVSPVVQDLTTPRQDVDLTPRASTVGITNIESSTSPHAPSPHLLRGDSMHNPSPGSAIFQHPPAPPLGLTHAPPIYGSTNPRSYSADHSMDLDALFDHFTSIDGTEQPGLPNQFMQNLGFAPNANLADLMTNDFGWGFNSG
jgi:hypothetical protein